MSDPIPSQPPTSQDQDDQPDTLICKPTKWFLWRVLAMLVMFSVFTALFVKDGIYGYREENLHFYVQKNFVQAGSVFQENKEGVAESEAVWKTYASAQRCVMPDDADQVLPKDIETNMPWPQILVDGYAVMKEKGGQNGANKLWEDYTSKKSWDSKVAEHAHDAGTINQQFIAAGVAGALVLGTLFILIRTLRRSIRADREALYTQDGRHILYTDMVRIDKRKWDTKGLATVYYTDGGEEKKAKIDGMVYGQFKPEDGAPAEKLFARVMENFKGEVLEYVDEEEDDETEGGDEESRPEAPTAEA